MDTGWGKEGKNCGHGNTGIAKRKLKQKLSFMKASKRCSQKSEGDEEEEEERKKCRYKRSDQKVLPFHPQPPHSHPLPPSLTAPWHHHSF